MIKTFSTNPAASHPAQQGETLARVDVATFVTFRAEI